MKRENYVRIQYQHGDTYISSLVKSNNPISLADLIKCIAILPRKVEPLIGKEKASIVAVKCVDLIIKFSKNSNYFLEGNGGSISNYIDIKSKTKKSRTERVDIEVYGKVGKDLYDYEFITNLRKFIQNNFKPISNP